MWKIGKDIGDREGSMDVCVAAAGILKPAAPCLTYPAKDFQDVSVDAYSRAVLRLISEFLRSMLSTYRAFCTQRRQLASRWSASGMAAVSSC